MDSSGKSSSTPEPPPAGPSQPTSAFERWRRKAALVTGLGVSEEERLADLKLHQTRQCEKMKDYLMQASPAVVFMLKHLKLSGCEVPPQNVMCAPCDWSRAGGFSPNPGAVVLCSGHFFSQKHMETTLVHELVHMYDHCKFKVDWSNLRHHACSEIRANSLSGDCRYTRELRRGFAAFSKQHQACVRRRAVISVAENPACPDIATAEKAVNEVWDSCFTDTRPFDEFVLPPSTTKMFNKLALIALVTPFVAGLQIFIPDTPTSAGPITLKWVSEPGDPATFSFELVNEVFHNAFAVANNVIPELGSIDIVLPVVPVGAGYSLHAVNVGNINDVYAQTGQFSIGPNGATSVTSLSQSRTSSASASASKTTTLSVPPTTHSTTSTSAFGTTITTPSASATTSQTSAAPVSSAPANFNAAPAMKSNMGAIAAVLLSAVAGAVVL
ncbi:hypothetical protein DXG03_007344 [Asterophora parasitica]|uniref:Mitochondrial inner membrane protease ATP23 n=1 Tax=Asterophora parasitica TaxID=117018 RepID=A0A9P7G6J6_9AGAR|nr:hypothetical protein DXG03_007344 [Asterophora parasitica]